jgi:outer membrane protein assembly factor BamB
MLANDNQNVSPKAIWIAEAGQTVIQPATVIGRSLLLATQDSKLKSEGSKIQAFSLSDGKERWQYEFENARISGIQALRSESPKAEVAIVTASSAGSNVSKSWIVAIEESGKLRWQSSINATSFSAPHIQNEIIYLTSDANKLFVFAPKVSLEPIRQVSLDAVPSPAAPAVKEGTVFIPCQSSELLAVTQDGAARWRFEFNNEGEDWLDKTPTVSAGRVFCSSSGGRVFALDAASGELLWRVSIGDGLSLSEPVVHDSHVCVGTHSGLVALDIHNGWPVWTLETPRPVSAAPLVFGNTLFFTSQDHHLYAVDGGTGQEKWRYGLGRRIEMPPLIAQDILVVTDRGGMIVGFGGLSSLDLVQESDTTHETAQIDLWQKAKNYERNAQPLKAAALWMELPGERQQKPGKSWPTTTGAPGRSNSRPLL